MKNVMLALALACLIIAALPATAGTIYDDGPINGTIDAWTINFGFTVADTFTVSSGTSKIDSLTFGAWLFPGDVLQTVEVSMTGRYQIELDGLGAFLREWLR